MQKVRIPFEKNGREVSAFAAVQMLPAFQSAASRDIREDAENRFKHALPDFPELAHETITVARLDADREPDDVTAKAGMLNRIVYLPAEERSWMQTIYHELAHLAIQVRDERGDDVPTTSEEYCSLFAVSRMPPELIERGDISYLGEPDVPQEEWPAVCQRALEYRDENGANSHYIQRAREWLGVTDS